MRLQEQPSELAPGITAWDNPGNGFTSVLLHFTADPDGASEEDRRRGMTEEDFKKEHGLDFSSYSGKPVYPSFSDKLHVSENVYYDPRFPVWRGWDFGYHHPAVVYAQVHTDFWVLGELMGEDESLEQFIRNKVLPYEDALFGHDRDTVTFRDAADPAGRQVSDRSEHTSFAILANHGIFAVGHRTEIDEGLTLKRRELYQGTYKVHPRCRFIIEANKGGYRYAEQKPGKPAPLSPMKDGFFEHIMDAERYLMVNTRSVWAAPPAKPQPKKGPPLYNEVLRNKQHDDMFGDFAGLDEEF